MPLNYRVENKEVMDLRKQQMHDFGTQPVHF